MEGVRTHHRLARLDELNRVGLIELLWTRQD